jgi:acyl carrier protein
MQKLETEIKQLIIECLNLEDYKPEDIDSKAPLFGEGLGLDSIDALELGVALQKKYELSFSGGTKENKEYFYSIETLAKFVISNKKK